MVSNQTIINEGKVILTEPYFDSNTECPLQTEYDIITYLIEYKGMYYIIRADWINKHVETIIENPIALSLLPEEDEHMFDNERSSYFKSW